MRKLWCKLLGHRWVDVDWWDEWLPTRNFCTRCGKEKMH